MRELVFYFFTFETIKAVVKLRRKLRQKQNFEGALGGPARLISTFSLISIKNPLNLAAFLIVN